MKAFLLFMFFLSSTTFAIGQGHISLDEDKQLFCMIDTFAVELKYLLITPDKIESIDVLIDSNAISAYGDKAKYGAVIIKTKPNVNLLRVSDNCKT